MVHFAKMKLHILHSKSKSGCEYLSSNVLRYPANVCIRVTDIGAEYQIVQVLAWYSTHHCLDFIEPNMPPDKPRLYLALYARLKHPGTYHYALHVSPKKELLKSDILQGTKYHCKNIINISDDTVSTPWTYEAVKIDPNQDRLLLARILLGKVWCPQKLDQCMAEVAVSQDDPLLNCVEWARRAIALLGTASVLSIRLRIDWDSIKGTAIRYVSAKKQQGRYEIGWKGDTSRVATFDFATGKEVIP